MAVLSKVVLDMTPIIKRIIAPMIDNGLSGWIAFFIELIFLIVLYGVFEQFLLWASKLSYLRRVLSWGHTLLYEQYHLKQ